MRTGILALLVAAALPVPAFAQGAPAETGLLALDGGDRIHYEVAGAGPAVVLVHDGLLDSRSWDRVAPALSASHRVIRYDRRGSGRSSRPEAPYDPLDDLRRLLDHLGVERATVVGSSFGGALSLAFALAHPGRVEALVLSGPVVVGMPYSAHFNRRGAENSRPLQAGDTLGAVERWSADRFIVHGENPAARALVRRVLGEHPDHLTVRVDLMRGPLRDRPALRHLAGVGVPVLILVGEGDIPDVHAHAGAIQAGIPGAERVVVEGVGHLPQVERPEWFLERLRAFLAKQARAPA